MDRKQLVDCFKDTLMISESPLLKEVTEKAIESNKVYKENFVAKKKNVKRLYKDIFEYCVVEENTTFNATKKYLQYGKTAVLNFANPHNPGGGVHNGAIAQEECLCRSSNLYPCISNQNVFNDYYMYHKDMAHYFFSDRLIYTKDVIVFKDDSDVPQIMPKEEWFNVDVITCAAPYLAKRKYTNKTALKELFKGRIKNIFEATIDNDVAVIILGAFGCGAFKNPPEVVAKAFHEVIDENNYKDYFSKIVFAIKSNYSNDDNYYAFDDEFFGSYHTTLLETPQLPLIEPLRSRCDNFNDFMDYIAWKNSNKYYDKQFSILGDSISTLEGFNPRGYNIFYKGKFSGDEKSYKANVHEMEDTWWGKVIDFFGGELLVNNSWSGSRVTKLPQSDNLFPSGCSDERTGELHINNVMPDVIIVYLGTNDWTFGARRNDETHLLVDEMEYFESAYDKMLKKLKSNYPKAEIWCCTLCPTKMSGNPSFSFPENYNGNDVNYYNNAIRNIVQKNNCKLIDLYSYQLPYDSIDGSHPNVDGMNTLASLIIRSAGGKQIEQFFDCENGHHEYFVAKQYSEATKYICKKCGKIDFQSDCYDEFYDFKPPSKCSKCQGEFEMTDQSGSYDYYTCKDCGNHICVSPFSILNESEKENITMNEKIYSPDAEYVFLPPGRTVPLDGFSNTIRLFDTDTSETIEIQKVRFDIGRDGDCEIHIDNSSISRIHASFYYEKSSWFIMDKDSTNGTYLNGKKLEQNTKYELYPDDIISIAQNKEYVFFKTKSDTYQENELIIMLEKAIKDFSCDSSDDTNILKVIALLMTKVPVYFPLDYDFNEMFGNIDLLKLKIGDTITSTNDVKTRILTLQVPNGEELIPMFTSDVQAHKGPSANLTRLYPQDYLPIVISMNKSVVINPFDEYNITIKTAFLKDILFPLLQDSLQQKELTYKKSDEISVGTVIGGKYELISQVGRGAFTETYLAKDKRLNKMWAAKICTKDNSSVINAMINEINMVKNLNHNVIPHIVDIIDNNEYFCIIEDYIEGATLEDIVKNYGAQPQDKVVDWAKQICDVLGYLHSQNPPLIHRDIKPKNIILKPDGNIVLIDFGIMRTYKPNNLADTVPLGTKGYAAPEQYGSRQTDARTDIYGLGMTMYHLLTGLDPKESDFVIRPICQINPNLPKDLEYIIDKCIKLDPKDRYQSCKELLHVLNNNLQPFLPPKKGLFSKILGKK